MGAYRFGQTVRSVVDYVTGSTRRKAQIEKLQQDSREKGREIARLESFLVEAGSRSISLEGEAISASQRAYDLGNQVNEREAELESQRAGYDQKLDSVRRQREQDLETMRGEVAKGKRRLGFHKQQLAGLLRTSVEDMVNNYIRAHPGDFAMVVDRHDRIVDVSLAGLKMLGYEIEDVRGMDIYELIDVDKREHIRSKLTTEIRRDNPGNVVLPGLKVTLGDAKKRDSILMDAVVVPLIGHGDLRVKYRVYAGALVRLETRTERRVRLREAAGQASAKATEEQSVYEGIRASIRKIRQKMW